MVKETTVEKVGPEMIAHMMWKLMEDTEHVTAVE
jgi:hypothetical protein